MSMSKTKTVSSWTWRAAILFSCLCAVTSPLLLFVSKPSINRPPALLPIQQEVPDLNTTEDPEGCSDWFFSQRAYPSGDLPADARETAWESISRRGIQTQSI